MEPPVATVDRIDLPPNNLTFFPHFPSEVRQLIWRLVLPLEPRVIHVEEKRVAPVTTISNIGQPIQRASQCSTSDRSEISDENSRYFYTQHRSFVDTLAQTCQESRQLVQESYELVFANRSNPARIWFNFDRDYLLLGVEDASLFCFRPTGKDSPWNISRFNINDLRKVKELAVHYPTSYCRRNSGHLKSLVQTFGNLTSLHLVQGDFSELDRTDLRIIPLDYYSHDRCYINRSWQSGDHAEDYVETVTHVEIIYKKWNIVLSRHLQSFRDIIISQDVTANFSVPEVKQVSVVSSKDYRFLELWKRVIPLLKAIKTQDEVILCSSQRQKHESQSVIGFLKHVRESGPAVEARLIPLCERWREAEITKRLQEAQEFERKAAIVKAKFELANGGIPRLALDTKQQLLAEIKEYLTIRTPFVPKTTTKNYWPWTSELILELGMAGEGFEDTSVLHRKMKDSEFLYDETLGLDRELLKVAEGMGLLD